MDRKVRRRSYTTGALAYRTIFVTSYRRPGIMYDGVQLLRNDDGRSARAGRCGPRCRIHRPAMLMLCRLGLPLFWKQKCSFLRPSIRLDRRCLCCSSAPTLVLSAHLAARPRLVPREPRLIPRPRLPRSSIRVVYPGERTQVSCRIGQPQTHEFGLASTVCETHSYKRTSRRLGSGVGLPAA